MNDFVDFYRLIGGKNLEKDQKKWDRFYVTFYQKQWYFEDIKSYNSFVRIKRDHFKKMGIGREVELDFYEVNILTS